MTETAVAGPVAVEATPDRPTPATMLGHAEQPSTRPALGGLSRRPNLQPAQANPPPRPHGLIGRIRRKLTTTVKVDATGVIEAVQDAGRPEPTFGPRMGSHTTAWATHVFGIEAALRGHPLAEATMRLDMIVSEIERLPGYELLATAPEAQKKRWAKALAALHETRQVLSDPAKPAAATDVQNYITAYLTLREALPMSVIDSAQMTSGNPTAGTGETVNVLMQHTRGEATEPVHLLNEIVGLLDVGRIAQALAELDDEQFPAIVPGLPTAMKGVVLDQRQRAEVLVTQHLRSIQTSFPGALAALSGVKVAEPPEEIGMAVEGKVPDPAEEKKARAAELRATRDRLQQADEKALPRVVDRIVHDEILPHVVQLGLVRIDELHDKLAVEQRKLENAGGVSTTTKDERTATDTKNAALGKKRELQGKIDRLSLRIGLTAEATSASSPSGKKSDGLPDSTSPTDDTSSKPGADGRRASGRTRKRAVSVVEDKAAQEQRVKDLERRTRMINALRGKDRKKRKRDSDAVTTGNITVQIDLTPENTVAKVNISGRPKSPFSGTMGAHTTAWVVHEDRIRTLILTKPVAKAIDLVTALADERAASEHTLGKTFAIHRPMDEVDDEPDVEPVAEPAVGGVADTGESPLKKRRLDTTGIDHQVGVLQHAIQAHFEAVNQIPGAGLPGGTGGDSEGAARGVLATLPKPGAGLPIEQGPVRDAIAQLLDVRYLDEDEETDSADRDINITGGNAKAKRVLAFEHLKTIDKAYPYALATAGLAVPKKVTDKSVTTLVGLLEKKAKTSNNGDGDADGNDRPKKRHKASHDPLAKTDAKADATPVADALPDTDLDEPTDVESMKLNTTLFGKAPALSSTTGPGGRPQVPRLTPAPREDPATANAAAAARRLQQAAYWFTETGDTKPDRVNELVAAYQQDVADAGTYLAEGEGDLVARQLGLFVHLYKGGMPPNFVRIENAGDGDCLIHALWQVRKARDLRGDGPVMSDAPRPLDADIPRLVSAQGGASTAEIASIRADLRDDLLADAGAADLRDAVIPAIIGNAVDGRPPDRVGKRVRALLHGTSFLSAVRVIRERNAINAFYEAEERAIAEAKKAHAEAKKARAEAAKAALLPTITSDVDTEMTIDIPSSPPPVIPESKAAADDVPIVHHVSIGAGVNELTHQALLHVDENHYVAILRTR